MTTYALDRNDYLRPREVEIVRLYAQGYNYKEIAHQLGLKPESIHRYTYNAQMRLGANVFTLVYQAHKIGIIQ